MSLVPATRRVLRTFAVLMALVANLVAAGVPLLHAMAHEVAEEHHPAEGTGAAVEHGHDEVHPESLHDAQLLVKRHSIDLSFIVPLAVREMIAFSAPATVQHRPALRLVPRAPPTPGLARAPPSA